MAIRSLLLGVTELLLLQLISIRPSHSFSWHPASAAHHPRQFTLHSNTVRRQAASTSTSHDDDDDHDDICRRTLDAALAKMAAISESEFSARFNKRRIRSVEVKQSSIPGAGLGLFAKEKIKAGTIISFYPVHSLGIELGDGSTRRVSIDVAGKTHEQQQQQQPGDDNDEDTDQSYLHHILGTRSLMKTDIVQDLGASTIFLDVDLSQQESPGFVSHMINDGATVFTNTEDGALAYYQASRKAKNCVHVPFGPSPLLATVTTKKVKKGEEFLTTYGVSYWLESLLKEIGEEETDMTDSIVLEAKEVAMDVLKGMKSVAVRHANEAKELQAIFDAP